MFFDSSANSGPRAMMSARGPQSRAACCARAPSDDGPEDFVADAGSARHRYVFQVRGLDCAEEVRALRREVAPLVGGPANLAFDVMSGRMMVLAKAPPVPVEAIRAAVRRSGMSATLWQPGGAPARREDNRQRRWQLALTAASGAFLALGLVLDLILDGGLQLGPGLGALAAAEPVPLAAVVAYVLGIVCGGRYVVVKAWYAARRLRADMNLLMTIAVAGAVAIGAWFEAATVAFLFALSLALESWSVERARRAVASLLELAPPLARLKLASGEEREVAAAEVEVGARIVVHPGKRFPLDGRVVAGRSEVDQAPITGESAPVAKAPEAEIYAGTINGTGALEIAVTRSASDTVLARIIRQVSEAHARRARTEQWVDRFAALYTPAAVVLAVLVALVPPVLLGGAWAVWFYNALVLLVIACPCALVISTPVSIVAALAAAARGGVLIKGGAHLETAGRLQAIAFDKTGTLTEGRPVVVGLEPLGGHSEAELLARAAALELRSAHPLARAIVAHACGRGIEPAAAADVRALPGQGVAGRFDGREFWLGSQRMLNGAAGGGGAATARAEALEAAGRTVVLVGTGDHVCGLIALAEAPRPAAARVLAALREAGIAHLVMLTGDNRTTAERIASEVGIDDVRAGLLPDEKVVAVEQLVACHGHAAMVGDGVNDAPAMARAHLGIAMGAIGSDAAIETADVALMSDDLEKLPWLIRHARRTLTVIRANIAFALAVKALFATLAVLGLATLWGAIAADVGASLLVVANGLRLLRSRGVSPRRRPQRPRKVGADLARKAR